MSLFTRSYSDLNLSFEAHPITKDVLKKTNVNAIMGSLRNLLKTSHYERLFQPQIGCNLRSLLFEPLDAATAATIATEIENTINGFEPRVQLTEVRATPDYDHNGFDVSITFFILNTTDPITASLFLERVR